MGFSDQVKNNELIDKGATCGIADHLALIKPRIVLLMTPPPKILFRLLILFSFYKLAVSVSLVYWLILCLTSRRSPIPLIDIQEGDLAYHSTKSNTWSSLLWWPLVNKMREQPKVAFFRWWWYERGVILSKTRLVVFLEPTQIYRFLRTRNLIAVSEYSTHLYLNLTALNCWWKMTDIRPPSFFFLSPYFCTGHSPSCLTEMVEQMPEGMESGETGILLFFFFCHNDALS